MYISHTFTLSLIHCAFSEVKGMSDHDEGSWQMAGYFLPRCQPIHKRKWSHSTSLLSGWSFLLLEMELSYLFWLSFSLIHVLDWAFSYFQRHSLIITNAFLLLFLLCYLINILMDKVHLSSRRPPYVPNFCSQSRENFRKDPSVYRTSLFGCLLRISSSACLQINSLSLLLHLLLPPISHPHGMAILQFHFSSFRFFSHSMYLITKFCWF